METEEIQTNLNLIGVSYDVVCLFPKLSGTQENSILVICCIRLIHQFRVPARCQMTCLVYKVTRPQKVLISIVNRQRNTDRNSNSNKQTTNEEEEEQQQQRNNHYNYNNITTTTTIRDT